MLGFRVPPPPPSLNFVSNSKPIPPTLPPLQSPNFASLSPIRTKSQTSYAKNFRSYAQNGNDKDNKNDGLPTENGNDGNDEKVENGRPRLNLRWVDLVLDPDPNNIVAVGLTGLLTWASVQVLWQLFVISAAILLAALKYTIVATLLIFILIALL